MLNQRIRFSTLGTILHRALKQCEHDVHRTSEADTIRKVYFLPLRALMYLTLSTLQRNDRSISRPPGVWLLHFAEFIYSKKKYESVLLPTIADMREEYFEALATERTWKARWVVVRGHWSFWAAVVTDVPLSALGLIKKLWTAAS